MSAYDDAVAYLDAEVHPRCDYEIYSDMRDIVDEMEAENAKLREMAAQALQIIKRVNVVMAIDYARYGALMSMARELGIEVSE